MQDEPAPKRARKNKEARSVRAKVTELETVGPGSTDDDIVAYFRSLDENLSNKKPNSYEKGMELYGQLSPELQVKIRSDEGVPHSFQRKMNMYHNHEVLASLGLE